MNLTVICSRCGKELSATWAGRLCTGCMVRDALELTDHGLHAEETPTLANPSGTTGIATLGRTFGDYELLAEIAHGGMGVVYKARQKSLGRLVAIKIMQMSTQADATLIGRFRNEALATARLQHPSIVAVHDFGVCDGHRYLTMDYVEGVNLHELCAGAFRANAGGTICQSDCGSDALRA